METTNELRGEYLGDINIEVVLRHITNFNPHWNSMPVIRSYREVPFTVTADFEFDPDWTPLIALNTAVNQKDFVRKLLFDGKRFVRLIIEPDFDRIPEDGS